MTISGKFLYYWLPVIACCLVIFLQSSVAVDLPFNLFPHSDKFFHFFVYAGLGALFLRACCEGKAENCRNSFVILSILASSEYGLSDEIHQSFVPGRCADILDFGADAAGSLFGAILYRMAKTYGKPITKQKNLS
ncbi:VanZ family protein [Desulfobacterales bacterium HSG16]|nr:VanZ family protein [Desulfobacterales bacterium HSG16]